MIKYQGTKEAWDTFVAANSDDGGVLQSWAWGKFQESLGRKIFRVVWGEQRIDAVCLLVEHRLPFGMKYVYAPRGPVITKERKNERTKEHILGHLSQFAKEWGVVFLRIEPPYHRETWNVKHKALRKTVPIQPRQTLRIDLTQSEDELLKSMHQKTRYNIGLAEKRGVHVKESNDIDTFWRLLEATTARDGFRMHPHAHYESILAALDARLFFATHGEQSLATALIVFFGDTAYYLHGASSNAHRDVMAPYALHWAIIQEAKRRGCRSYDLWGVDEKKWPGVTRFKNGFAPKTPTTEYVGTYDIQIQKILYTLYRLWRSFR